MRKNPLLLFLFFVGLTLFYSQAISSARAAPQPQATIVNSIFIQSPREGQALQGVEIIEVKIRGEGFQKGSIHFSYSDSPSQTRSWFFIAELQGENQNSSQTAFQVEWNTTLITDGDYDLRIIAEYSGGEAIFELVPQLRIRNHSPIETATPTTQVEGTGADTLFPPSDTPEPAITPTSLPPNPAEVRTVDLQRTLLISGITVAGCFFIGMIYWYLFNKTR